MASKAAFAIPILLAFNSTMLCIKKFYNFNNHIKNSSISLAIGHEKKFLLFLYFPFSAINTAHQTVAYINTIYPYLI